MKRIVRWSFKTLVILVLLGVPTALVMVIAMRPKKTVPYVPPSRANVEVVTVRRDTLDDVVVLPMCAETVEEGFVRVSAETSGAVTWLGPKEGEAVKAGDVILRIDTERLEAELASAQAGYVEAKQKHDRIRQLYEGAHISKDQLDTARAAFDRAAAAVQLAEVNVRKATVTSPIAGTVDRRYAALGEYVTPGMRLFDVVNVARLYAVVDVPERDRQYVEPGQMMTLTFENVVTRNPGNPLVVSEARVRSVSDMGSSATRTYRAKVEFDNADGRVKPGMLGTARICRCAWPDVIVVHRDFIVSSEGEKLVYVAADGKALARRVELGFTDGERFAVRSGLVGGERIIREPRQLTPGQPVRIRSIDGALAPEESDAAPEASMKGTAQP